MLETIKSKNSIEQFLRSYLAGAEYWDPEIGDTHEILGDREILSARFDELTQDQISDLRRADDLVISIVTRNLSTTGWDIAMLRKTADLILNDRAKEHRQAA